MFFASPAFVISHAAPIASAMKSSICGSIDTLSLRRPSLRMWMRLVVQLATAPIGYVGIELRRREIRVSEHFLDGAEVGAAFQEVGGEGVAEEVRVHPCRV